MRPAYRFLLILIGLTALLTAPPAAIAQDIEPPSFDLHQAIAEAAEGATIVVPPGVYSGPFLLDRAVTLVGEGMPVLQGSGEGDVVTIEAPGVTVRGFNVRGSGKSLDKEDAGIRVKAADATVEDNVVEDALFGIYLANAPRSIVRGNTILGKDLTESRRGDGLKVWYSPDSRIEGNTMRKTRDAVIWFSPNTEVIGNDFSDGRYGMHFMSTDNHLIENNVLRGNSVGIYLMYGSNYVLRNNLLADNRGPSGYGIGLKETNQATIEGNRMVNNRIGVYSDASPLSPSATVDFRSNLLAFNETGILALPNVERNTFVDNIFLENGEQVAVSGAGNLLSNQWSVEGRGNYWSDYRGFDADGDKVGDLPYESSNLFENLTATWPSLRLFALSPATDALDLAARAFPLFRPKPILADEHPLTAPPALPPVRGLPEPPVAINLALSLLLILIATAVLAFALRSFARTA